jgi:hypothetical protein
MKKASFALALLLAVAVALLPLAAAAPPPVLELGAPLPDAIAHSTPEAMRCLTAEAHFDPCAFYTVGNIRYVIAWDQATFRLVYLFTADAGFRTQSNLTAGGQTRVPRSRLLTFKSWQIDPRAVSAGWFPVVEPLDQPTIVGEQDETTALVIGFVRTVYLNERILSR